MLTLGTAGNTIQGVTTGASTAITYTIMGDEVAAATDSFKVLAQGQLPTSVAALYTVPASTQTLIKSMLFVNTTGAGVLFTTYINGTAAANSIGSFTIPANGTCIWTPDSGWAMRDANGSVVQTFVTPITLTGDVTGTGSGTVPTTLATVNGSPGTTGDASHVTQLTTNGKGLVTANSSVAIQIAESQVTNLTTDLAGKQATGNYITATTGDVVATGPGSVSATIQPSAVSLAKLANATANSVLGEFTGSAAAPQYLALAASTFPARSSSGNVVAKTITDAALALDSSGATTGTFGSASAFFPKEIAGTAYITAGNPQGWAGADFGAWVNAAWAYIVAAYPNLGGQIKVGPGIFTYSTPIELGTQFYAAKFSGSGSSSGFGVHEAGTTLNFTGTTTIAMTVGGGSNNSGNVALDSFSLIGTSSANTATGIRLTDGTTGSSSENTFTDVAISQFGNGITHQNASLSYGLVMINCKIQNCGSGYTPQGENNVMLGGLIGGCGTGIVGSNGGEILCTHVAFDDMSVTAVNISNNLARYTFTGCRWENPSTSGTLVTDTKYITISAGSCIIQGGAMSDDGTNAVAAATGFFQATGGTVFVSGLWVFSAGRPYTQLCNVSSGVTSFKFDPVITPTTGVVNVITPQTQWFNIATGVFPRQGSGSPQANVTAVTATTGSATTFFNGDSRGGFPFPVNARPGLRGRCTVHLSNTATVQTFNWKFTFGTANAATDASLATFAPGAGTAVASAATIVFDFVLTSATTMQVSFTFLANAGIAAAAFTGSCPAPITVAVTSASFLGFYFASTVANIVTCRSVNWEILST